MIPVYSQPQVFKVHADEKRPEPRDARSENQPFPSPPHLARRPPAKQDPLRPGTASPVRAPIRLRAEREAADSCCHGPNRAGGLLPRHVGGNRLRDAARAPQERPGEPGPGGSAASGSLLSQVLALPRPHGALSTSPPGFPSPPARLPETPYREAQGPSQAPTSPGVEPPDSLLHPPPALPPQVARLLQPAPARTPAPRRARPRAPTSRSPAGCWFGPPARGPTARSRARRNRTPSLTQQPSNPADCGFAAPANKLARREKVANHSTRKAGTAGPHPHGKRKY